jgi:hypothetical protein
MRTVEVRAPVPATTVPATTVPATTVPAAAVSAATVSAATVPAAAAVPTTASAGVCLKSEKRHYQEQRSDHPSRGHQHWHCNVARRRCQLARIPSETKSF